MSEDELAAAQRVIEDAGELLRNMFSSRLRHSLANHVRQVLERDADDEPFLTQHLVDDAAAELGKGLSPWTASLANRQGWLRPGFWDASVMFTAELPPEGRALVTFDVIVEPRSAIDRLGDLDDEAPAAG